MRFTYHMAKIVRLSALVSKTDTVVSKMDTNVSKTDTTVSIYETRGRFFKNLPDTARFRYKYSKTTFLISGIRITTGAKTAPAFMYCF